MFKVQEEDGLKVMAECLRLGDLHYEEIYEKDRQEKIPRSYNWEYLKLCHDSGLMHIITARDEEDNLIGYFVLIISPDMFSSTFVAKDMAIYVDKTWRNKGVFDAMLKMAEDGLRDCKVSSLILGFQKGYNEELPKKYGYKLRELMYEKVLVED